MSEAWRAIITVSFDDDDGSAWTAINDALTTGPTGFLQRGKTGTWETLGASAGAVSLAVRQALDRLAERNVLDHVWIYIDKRTG